VLPIDVDTRKWDMLADTSLMHQLQNGKTNLLFVCCLAPNKRQENFLEAFALYLTIETNYAHLKIESKYLNLLLYFL
jgi:hypothetical protein